MAANSVVVELGLTRFTFRALWINWPTGINAGPSSVRIYINFWYPFITIEIATEFHHFRIHYFSRSIKMFTLDRYLHDVPECLLVKNCPTPPGLPIPVANKIQKQYNTKTGPQTDDVWRILWRQREREAVATDFLRRPYATPEWRWFWHANKTGFPLLSDFL